MRGAFDARPLTVFVMILLLGSSVLAAPAPAATDLVVHEDGLPLDAGPGLSPLALDALGCRDDLGCPEDTWMTWTQQAPLSELEHSSKSILEDGLGAPAVFPAPDTIAVYNGLDETEKRQAWRAWFLVEQIAAMSPAEGTPGAMFPGDAGAGSGSGWSSSGAGEPGALPSSVPDPHGLSGVWRLEGHGFPLAVIPAGPEGATFLHTSEGVLSFPEPGADPDWMVRPSGYVGRVEATQPGSSGYRDLVIGLVPWSIDDEPSLRVIDGETGEVKFRGFSGDEGLVTWSLTALDDGGTEGIIGLDVMGNVVSADLEGDVLYRERLPGFPSEMVFPPLVPAYVALLYLWMGVDPFGDANGDGTLDLFTGGGYYAFVFAAVVAESFQSPPVLSAYSGRDLGLLWHSTLVPPSEYSYWFPVGGGDLDGDGRDDLLVYEIGYTFLSPVPAAMSHNYLHVLSGENGAPLAQAGRACAVTCVDSPITQAARAPDALADLDGDGTISLVHLEASLDYEESPPVVNSLEFVVRDLGDTPVSPFEETRHELPVPEGGAVWGSDLFIQETSEGSRQEVLLLVQFLTGASDDAHETELYRLHAGGVESVSLPEPYGMVQMDPADGTWYGWLVGKDAWQVLDEEEWTPKSDGFRLVVDTGSVLEHDRSGDGVEDLLLRRSIGYTWVSGASGVMFEEFDRSLVWWMVDAFEFNGKQLLVERQRYEDEYRLVDLEGEVLLEVGEDLLDERYFRGFVDVTADGRLDLWVQERGEWDDEYNWIPGDNLFIDLDGDETLHTVKGESGVGVYVDDYVLQRDGEEVLKSDSQEDDLSLELQVVGEEGPRWELDYDGDLRTVSNGVLVLTPVDSAPSSGEDLVVAFYDMATGGLLHEDVVEAVHDQVRIRFDSYRLQVEKMTTNGTFQAVYVYNVEDAAGETVEQSLRVVSLTGNEVVADFRLTDPPLLYEDYWNWVRPAYLAGLVEGWGAGKSKSLVFYEDSRAVVRALDGKILAVGPKDHYPTHALDVDGDGRDELGLRQGQRLQFMEYDPLNEGAGFEDDGERINGTQLVSRDGVEDVDGEKTGLPGPAAVLVVALVGLAVVGLRRRV